MSNIGKSHWARRRLERESGFKRLSCDELIEQRLAPELKKLGYRGLRDVAAWMGQPYDSRYAETSRTYLACERDIMLDIIERLRAATQPMVIDTTGSVIYTSDDILEQIRALTKVVYLQASDGHVSQLFRNYLKNPKPVIWGDSFAPRQGEAPMDALQRCYPDLLKFRDARYRAVAHVHIAFERHRAADATWDKLMAGL